MKKDLIEAANSFKTFDTMYDLLKKGDYSFLSREYGTNNYPEIGWMIQYFTENEEYEKCKFLTQLNLPKPLKINQNNSTRLRYICLNDGNSLYTHR